jgi:CubicO group peptidase (beta-lactamase class C family)
VTVIRNGYLVADVTFHPYESNTMHSLASVTKNITSILIGIAIQQGHIKDVDQSVLSFFPNRTAANLDKNKENMTLEHVLTMRSGFDCSWENEGMGFGELFEVDDWVQFILDQPMAYHPGTQFDYCNINSVLLSIIIQETTGRNTFDFAKEHLFGPLGIEDVIWGANLQGISVGSGGLMMKPHDMAKIGYLFLNEGRWDDTEIISPDWVVASTHKHTTGNSFFLDGYGYQWWTRDDGVYCAAGHGGQFIYVIPEQDMVVVFTANLIPYFPSTTPRLLKFVTKAVQSSAPLPPNPEGFELLNSKIQQAAQNQVEPEPVPPLPEIAGIVSGQTYILDPNPLAIQSVSVTFPGESVALLEMTYNFDEFWFSVDREDLWTDMERPVGLDNVYRFSPGWIGFTMGMKGAWVSDDTFVIDIDNISHIGKDHYRLIFLGDEINLWIINGQRTEIIGKLKD